MAPRSRDTRGCGRLSTGKLAGQKVVHTITRGQCASTHSGGPWGGREEEGGTGHTLTPAGCQNSMTSTVVDWRYLTSTRDIQTVSQWQKEPHSIAHAVHWQVWPCGPSSPWRTKITGSAFARCAHNCGHVGNNYWHVGMRADQKVWNGSIRALHALPYGQLKCHKLHD